MARARCRFFALSVVLLLAFSCIPTEAILAAMSIDLGSQYTKLGIVKAGVPMEIVLNRESMRKTPTILTIKGHERSFSDIAAQTAVKYPQHAFPFLVDLLGKKFDNPIVHQYHKRFPHLKLIPDDNRGTVLFEMADGATYSPETLLAMLLADFRRVVEAFAGQPVKDVVVTVPPYLNQAERRAVVAAAHVAGLNLLQLLNDNTAAGLNYGMFRRKQFTEESTTMLIYDMGASKTTATVLEYQVVADKTGDKNPQMSTLGVGFDRTLGGFEMTLRLRDRLVDAFAAANPSLAVADNGRAMAKLLKEADRVKQVLSANADHFAQVENVMNDVDFKLGVSREQFEDLCADIFPRLEAPIKDALKMAELSIDQIDTFVLMGGSTRVPKVQETLQAIVKGKELGKFLNTDEAIAMGAVYQAAHLSQGFKVKKFIIKDANLFPIQALFPVDFARERQSEDEEARVIHRTLFGLKNPLSQKKVMTFSKHTHDFEFAVNYGDMHHLTAEQLAQFGELNVTRVDVGGVAAAVEGNTAEGVELKGVKVHFRLDDSGIVSVDAAEFVVEKPPQEEQSTLSAIGDKIRGFFGGGGDGKADEPPKEDDKKEDKATAADTKESATDENAKKAESDESAKPPETPDSPPPPVDEGTKKAADEKTTDTNATAANETTPTNATGKSSEPPKPSVVKVALQLDQACMDLPNMTRDDVKEAKKLLREFDKHEEERRRRAEKQNELEALLFELRDKLEQDEYRRVSTDDERQRIGAQVDEAAEWFDETADESSAADDFDKRIKTLNDATKELFAKHEEFRERPRAVDALKQMLNHSTLFLAGIKNLTDETQIFTEAEIAAMEKLVNDTEKWWAGKQEDQAKLADYDKPAITMYGVAEKIQALDREVKYLLNKAKITPPKKKVENETATEAETETPPPEHDDTRTDADAPAVDAHEEADAVATEAKADDDTVAEETGAPDSPKKPDDEL